MEKLAINKSKLLTEHLLICVWVLIWEWLWDTETSVYTGVSLVSLISPGRLSRRVVGYFKCISAYNDMIMCSLSFCLFIWWIAFVHLYIFNHSYISEMKSTWLCWIFISICSIKFASIPLRLFSSMFIREIGLHFSFFVYSSCGLDVNVTMAQLKKKLGGIPSVNILWNNLWSIGVNSYLNKFSCLFWFGDFLDWRLLNIASISLWLYIYLNSLSDIDLTFINGTYRGNYAFFS